MERFNNQKNPQKIVPYVTLWMLPCSSLTSEEVKKWINKEDWEGSN